MNSINTNSLKFECVDCSFVVEVKMEDQTVKCNKCGKIYLKNLKYIDLLKTDNNITKTAEHYGVQWSDKLGFHKFMQQDSSLRQVMPMSKLGWNGLFEKIKKEATLSSISVYDAACGYGDITDQLLNSKENNNITYYGADIQLALNELMERIPSLKYNGWLLRWDISNILPVSIKFDYVLCKAAIHHTPNPAKTFESLCSVLKEGGTIAISAYRKKAICRENNDDILRKTIGVMNDEMAFEKCKQLTELGKQLQNVQEKIEICEDLPILGILKGTYKVQEFIYNYFLKCFYNESFGDKYSTLVNYDWYHPEFAFRYDIAELREWFSKNNIKIIKEITIEAQHYVEGIKLHV